MSPHCNEMNGYVDQDTCEECESEKCSNSPQHNQAQAKAKLEKLRSSEFATDVMNRLTAVFPMKEDEIGQHLDGLFQELEADVRATVIEATRDAIKVRAARYVNEKMQSMLDSIFAEAVGDRILQLQQDDKTLMTTIREQATSRIKAFLAEQKRDKRHGCGEDDPITKQIQGIVDERVSEAIAEIKSEAIDRFNKEAMKRMMSGMAKAIGEDKRLLNLLTA